MPFSPPSIIFQRPQKIFNFLGALEDDRGGRERHLQEKNIVRLGTAKFDELLFAYFVTCFNWGRPK